MPASYNDLFADSRCATTSATRGTRPTSACPARWAGERIVLRFDSATHRAVVWVDGTQVAEHEGGYTPFEADVTDVVELGRREPHHGRRQQRPDLAVDPAGLRRRRPGRAPPALLPRLLQLRRPPPAGVAVHHAAVAHHDVTVVTGLDGADGAVRYAVEAAGRRARGPRRRCATRRAPGRAGDGRRRRAHGRGRPPVAPRRGLPLRARRRAVGRRRRAGRRLRAAGRHPHRAGRRHALSDQRRAVLLQRLRQARGHRRARQGRTTTRSWSTTSR